MDWEIGLGFVALLTATWAFQITCPQHKTFCLRALQQFPVAFISLPSSPKPFPSSPPFLTCPAWLLSEASLSASDTCALAALGTQASATSTLRVKSRFILLRV